MRSVCFRPLFEVSAKRWSSQRRQSMPGGTSTHVAFSVGRHWEPRLPPREVPRAELQEGVTAASSDVRLFFPPLSETGSPLKPEKQQVRLLLHDSVPLVPPLFQSFSGTVLHLQRLFESDPIKSWRRFFPSSFDAALPVRDFPPSLYCFSFAIQSLHLFKAV